MIEYIEREKVIKELHDVYEYNYPTASGDFDEYASQDVPNIIRSIPTADVQPVRRGKWICTNNYEILAYGTLHYSRCSVCGEESLEEGSFCPNCGAEMRGEDDA